MVVGSEKMAVFDDTAEHKLVLYPHKVEWKNRVPTAVKAEGEVVALEDAEPLRDECQHFLDCVRKPEAPLTDGAEGLRVLRVLDACQRALRTRQLSLWTPTRRMRASPSVLFRAPIRVRGRGRRDRRGHQDLAFFARHEGARIGRTCVIGQNVNVDGGTVIGNNVKIQNNVSVYTGAVIEDDVFLGRPAC